MPDDTAILTLRYETSKIDTEIHPDAEVWIDVYDGATFSSIFVDERGRRWVLSDIDALAVCYRPETRR